MAGFGGVPPVARAIVSRAPAGVDDGVRVTLVNFTSIHDFEVAPKHWMPRGGTLPAVGDTAAVCFDDDGDCWLVAYDRVANNVGTDARLDALEVATPAARAHMPVAQGAVIATLTALIWNNGGTPHVSNWEQGGVVLRAAGQATSGNFIYLYANEPGIYQASLGVVWTPNNTGNRYLDIVLGDASTASESLAAADRRVANSSGEAAISVPVKMDTGDYIYGRAYHDGTTGLPSGSFLYVLAAVQSFMSLTKIGRL